VRPSELDAIAAAAWPAAITERVGGWTVRLTPGTHGRRLNSAVPPPHAPAPPPAVARWYEDRGAAPLVQVTPLEEQAVLDDALAAAGWTAEMETDVLVRPPAAGPRRGTVPQQSPRACVVERVSLSAWRAAWRELGTHERSGGTDEADVLTRIPFETAGLIARRDGALAGVALAVVAERWSIVFEVATAPEHRRRGVARALMAAWAEAAGDRGLFLQVTAGNAAGHALYAALGFERSHGYHYRRRA
jgi:ribosomal protein S18 acetylase RimI-like enzyme